MKTNTNIIWFENDLRIHDHEGLWLAKKQEIPSIGIYIIEKKDLEVTWFGIPKMGQHRLQFLAESLTDLKAQLKTINIQFYVFIDSLDNVFKRLKEHIEIKTLYHQKAYGSEEVKRHSVVDLYLDSKKIVTYDTKPLYHLQELPTTIEDMPDIFTHFRQQIEKKGVIRQTYQTDKEQFVGLFCNLSDDFEHIQTLYEKNDEAVIKGGTSEAIKRIDYYFFETKKIKFYKQTRNQMLRWDDSSKFSPYLAMGCVSPRYIYEKLKAFEETHGKNISTYWLYFELLWRDFFHYIHVKYQDKVFYKKGLYNRPYEPLIQKQFIEAWKQGQTGYPLVDANMIELKKTGWMSNRGRQNVASFFCHYIKQDWRMGAAWFEYLLLDYDVSSNYGNWLYQAGLGVDPRNLRIFDVHWQGNQYDKTTLYLRRWLPQFKKIPKDKRYDVTLLTADEQKSCDFILGKDYPYPIVKKPFIPRIKKK